MSCIEAIESLRAACSDGAELDAAAALDVACKLSLDPGSRSELVKGGAAELASSQLSAAVTALCSQASAQPDGDSDECRRASLALRLCRNLCAGQPAAREVLKSAAAPAEVHTLVSRIVRLQPPPVSLLSIAMQMLCNLCVEDSEACESVWSLFDSDTFSAVARLRVDGAGPTLAPLCLLLRASCQRSDACRLRLLSLAGARGVLTPLLEWTAEAAEGEGDGAAHSRGEAARWLTLLATDLCGHPGAVRDCLGSLGPSEGEDAPLPGVTVPQGIFLHLLAEGLEERANELDAREGEGDETLISAQDVSAVCALVQRAAAAVPEASAVRADDGASGELGGGGADPAAGTVLAGGLRVIQSAALVAGELTTGVMLASGIVQTAVSLLARLGPPTGPRGSRPAPSGPGPWVEEEFNARQASPSSSAARGAGVGPIAGGGAAEASSGAAPAELYFGFRRDLVAVVGNLCHARPAAVDALMRADGVAIILQQCRGDEGDSFLREWAVWAVRNICEVSKAARDSIKELQPVGVEKRGDDLARMGLDVEWDAELNRPVLRGPGGGAETRAVPPGGR